MAADEKKVRDLLSVYGPFFAGQGKGAHDICFRPVSQCHNAADLKIKLRHTAEEILLDKTERYKRRIIKIW